MIAYAMLRCPTVASSITEKRSVSPWYGLTCEFCVRLEYSDPGLDVDPSNQYDYVESETRQNGVSFDPEQGIVSYLVHFGGCYLRQGRVVSEMQYHGNDCG